VSELVQHVRAELLKRFSHRRSQKFVVAVSGGLDSMVLLRLLREALPHPAHSLVVAHFNHQLRGKNSDADQCLVKETAESTSLTCRTGSPKKAYEPGSGSLEMWARRERHAFLAATARAESAETIVTAHHADDLVELVFLRLLRGEAASIGGMAAESPAPFDPDLTLFRPLLRISKEALLSTAKAIGIPYREDISNRDPSFRRNWIRSRLIPPIVERFGPSVTTTVQRCAEILGDESDYMDAQAEAWLTKAEQERVPRFAELPPALQRRIVLKQLKAASLPPDFGHIEQLRIRSGSSVMLEGAASVALNGHGSLVRSGSRNIAGFTAERLDLDLESPAEIQFGPLALRWNILPLGQPFSPIEPRREHERFDADAIGPSAILRHWQPGDRFQPSGFGRAAKIQNLFVSAKIPVGERRRLAVATRSDGEVFWVEGLRISEKYKLGPKTRRYLDWRWQRLEPLLATPMSP
jgi:tRNA(Ile)-lysidine synthase